MRVLKSSFLLIICLSLLSSCDLYNPNDKRSEVGKINNEKTHQETLVDEITANDIDEELTDENNPVTEETSDDGSSNESTTEEVAPNESTTEESDALTADLEAEKEKLQLAKDLNSEGFALYKAAKYEGALAKFEESFKLDDAYFYSHFNYACTLGVLMKEDGATWNEYKDDAIDHLLKAIEADSSLIDKILTDTDLDPIRSEARYLEEILGN